MMNGRVETYLHSDNVTQNKGCATVCVVCDSDFAARTDQFVEFAKRMAMMVYACQHVYKDAIKEAGQFPVKMIDIVESEFPTMIERRKNLEKEIKEKVQLREFSVITL